MAEKTRGEAARALDNALCNFLNAASDPWDPVDRWRDEVKRAFAKLGNATSEARKAGVFNG